tara:strand:- start:204 stop:890 length:687 start_codon:yes stop_codon:yes gene_type:complete
MKILVISMENENGAKRRNYLNYDYERIIGCEGNSDEDPYVKHVKEKMKLRYNTLEKTINGFSGNFASHLKTLEYIVEKQYDEVIICDDDSILTNPIPTDLPNEVCLLSGQICHPNNWNKDRKWKKDGKNLEIISNFVEGVNEIDYNLFRWTQANAYYIPSWEVGKKFLEDIKKINTYKSLDHMLSKSKLIKLLYYPAIFKHHDYLNKSQVASNPGVIVNYVKQNNQKG